MARENRNWGYQRIVGALRNPGHEVGHQTVGNVLRRYGLGPAPEREKRMAWRGFIRFHTAAGIQAVTLPPWSPNLNAHLER